MEGDFHTLGPWENPGPFKASIVLLIDTYGRVSIQFRDDFKGVKARGFWGLFGGEIETGETARQAAAREIAEETGLDIPENTLKPFVKTLSETGENGQHYVFLCTQIVDASKVTLHEGAGFAFIHKDQLEKFDLIPAARRVLAYYFAHHS